MLKTVEYRRRASRDRSSRKPRRTPGAFYTRYSYRDAVENGCLKDGVPVFKPNMIRHAYATRVRREYGLEAAQVVLGHSKADLAQIYAERDMALAGETAAKIG